MVELYFFVTLVGTILCIPVYMRIADKFGLIDKPEWGKIHSKSTSTMGGLAFLFTAVTIGLVFTDFFSRNPGFLIGLGLIALLGTLDDLRKLPTYRKLKPLWTVLAVGIVVGLDGLNIPYLFSPLSGEVVSLAWGGPLLVLFLVFCKTNSVNFIDGIDGLAAGTTAIVLSFIAGISFATGQIELANISLIFLGSILGFLIFNYPPASIFMGDVGSLSLGFIIGVFAIMMTFPLSESGLISLMTPVYILGLTTIDTVQVVIARLINRENIFRADTKHLHHKLMRAGLSEKETTLTMYGITLFLGGLGLALASTSLVLQFWLFVGIFFAISGGLHWMALSERKYLSVFSEKDKKPLGNILLEIEAIERKELQRALSLKNNGGSDKPIGKILKEEGAIGEDELREALLIQSRMQVDER